MMLSSLPELIQKKRDGGQLENEEIKSFIQQTVSKTAQDCQIGAMLMAIYWRGMTDLETIQLTSAMKESGDVLEWPVEIAPLLADKHSTGGVGDKISLPLAPALAACGLKVPMVSGRGLDLTGGTLDKLESIPGYIVPLDRDQMEHALKEAGCFIAGQTDTLVPGDRELYKRRDVTATVTSDPLIIASIISKKAAAGVPTLIMDIKVGRAGCCKTVERARELAQKLISTATGLGIHTRAVLTRMDIPIGRSVGNALEVAESIECLRGSGSSDLMELLTTLGGVLLHMKGRVGSLDEGKAAIIDAINSGRALNHFEKMLKCQGVAAETARQLCHGNMWDVLPRVTPECITKILAPSDGYISDVDATEIARVCRELGSGRVQANQELDLRVGVVFLQSYRDFLKKGEAWLEVHHATPKLDPALRDRLSAALTLCGEQPPPHTRVIDLI